MDGSPPNSKAVGEVDFPRRHPEGCGNGGDVSRPRPSHAIRGPGTGNGGDGGDEDLYPAMRRIESAFKSWGEYARLCTWLKFDIIDEDALGIAFNVPDSALVSYESWQKSIEGEGSYSWEETDRWLRSNGYTGRVNDGYISKEQDARKKRARGGVSCNWG